MSNSILDQIKFRARVRPHALAVARPVGPVSYVRLVEEIESLATVLLQSNIASETLVGLALGPTYLHLLAILALDRLNIPSMSLPPSIPASQIVFLKDHFALSAVVSAEPAPAGVACRWITMEEQQQPKFGKPDLARLAKIATPADSLVRVTLSSGTTGGSKGIPISRTLQAIRFSISQRLRGTSEETRHYAAMPFSTTHGYSVSLSVLAGGGALILPDEGTDVFSLTSKHQIDSMAVTPATLSRMLAEHRDPLRRLDTMRNLEITGSHLPAGLVQDARFFLTPNLWSAYGSTESGSVARADAAICAADAAAVGYLNPMITAEIVDESGRILGPGEEGHLRLRGDSIVPGYYRDPEATQRAFRDGWFYPGDIGSIAPNGLLRIFGRQDEIINYGGIKIAPRTVEDELRKLSGVHDAALFAMTGKSGLQEPWAALVLGAGVDAAQLPNLARQRLGDRAPVQLIAVEALPRNENGKVLRPVLAEWAQKQIKSAT